MGLNSEIYLRYLNRELSRDLNFAIELALDGGQILENNFNSDYHVEKKEDGSLVTSIDRSVSTLICERIKKYYPNYALVDEENGDDLDRFNKDFCWVTDPLDSTSDYVNHRDAYSVIIGLMYQLQPVLGVTYRPQTNELTFATKNDPAYLIVDGDKNQLQVSDENDIHLLYTRSRFNESLTEMVNKVNPASEKMMGGFAKVIEVAKGDANLFLNPPCNRFHLWDLCGTSVILEEAGGKVTDIYGNSIDFSQERVSYNCGLIAASNKIHGKVINLLNE